MNENMGALALSYARVSIRDDCNLEALPQQGVSMAKTTIGFSLALIILGILSWVLTGRTSATALIPSGFGFALSLAGVLALLDKHRKHALHAAAAISILGIAGSLQRALPTAMSSGELRIATASQLLMALVLLVFLMLCIRSFILARNPE